VLTLDLCYIIKYPIQRIGQLRYPIKLNCHRPDAYGSLRGVIDEIIYIGKSDSKADYIKDHDAILIDDSFSERKALSDRLGIYIFDCSMVEVLLNVRR